MSYFGLEESAVEDLSVIDTSKEHKYGYALVKEGKLIQAISRTNPNAKWDWYTIGGRWSGFLTLKDRYETEIERQRRESVEHLENNVANLETKLSNDPTQERLKRLITEQKRTIAQICASGCQSAADACYQADSARNCEVDWYAMRAQGEAKAAEKWDNARALAPEDWESWESVSNRLDFDRAREFYNSQPAIEALRRMDCWGTPDEFLTDKETFVRLKGKSSVSPFALLYKGKWIERGEMGWFGAVSNGKDIDTWADAVWEIIKSLPEDELITMIDCHI